VLKLVGASLVGLLVVLGTPVLSAADEGDEGGGSILVVMDVSGSMERKDASGTTLIEGAREAIGDLVDSAPDETAVGLRLYGSNYPGNEKVKGCRDTERAVPIGPLSSTGRDIERAIDGAKPTGFTPIGYSLQQAAKDFPPEGQRTILLVSDGEDTCNTPAPCTAAKQLKSQGIDVRVDTVGLFLQGNAKAKKQLECIAKATGGSYYAADDTDALTEQLTAVSERAVQRFEASGEPVVGGPAATEAAAIEAGKAYTDDVAPGEAKWYSFEGEEGQNVTVTVTEDGSAEYGCCMFVRLVDPDLAQVASQNHYNNTGTAKSYRVTSFDDGLRVSGTHYVAVTMEADAEAEGTANLEIEVEVADGTATPSASPTPSETATPSASASPDTEASTETEQGGDGILWTIIGLLAVMVVGLAVAVVILFRRKG
jgi:Ca-activated chloride channel family protein